jgi:plasmid stabilization system protein ParE
MAWKVAFSDRSRVDLEKIVNYIARDTPAAAERFGFLLIAQAEALANTPEMGPILPQRITSRFFPVGRYLIIYRLDQKIRSWAYCAFGIRLAGRGLGDNLLSLLRARNSTQPFHSHNSVKWAQRLFFRATGRTSLRLQNFDEGFLRDVDFADAFHPLFSFFLFLEQFAFAGDVAAVAFCGDFFSQRRNAFARDDFFADRRLDRHLIKLARDHFF